MQRGANPGRAAKHQRWAVVETSSNVLVNFYFRSFKLLKMPYALSLYKSKRSHE